MHVSRGVFVLLQIISPYEIWILTWPVTYSNASSEHNCDNCSAVAFCQNSRVFECLEIAASSPVLGLPVRYSLTLNNVQRQHHVLRPHAHVPPWISVCWKRVLEPWSFPTPQTSFRNVKQVLHRSFKAQWTTQNLAPLCDYSRLHDGSSLACLYGTAYVYVDVGSSVTV